MLYKILKSWGSAQEINYKHAWFKISDTRIEKGAEYHTATVMVTLSCSIGSVYLCQQILKEQTFLKLSDTVSFSRSP